MGGAAVKCAADAAAAAAGRCRLERGGDHSPAAQGQSLAWAAVERRAAPPPSPFCMARTFHFCLSLTSQAPHHRAPHPFAPSGCARHHRIQRPRHSCGESLGGAAAGDSARRQHRQSCGCSRVSCSRSSGAHCPQPRRVCPLDSAPAAPTAPRACFGAAAQGQARRSTTVGHTKVRVLVVAQTWRSPRIRYTRYWQRSMRMACEAPLHHVVVAA